MKALSSKQLAKSDWEPGIAANAPGTKGLFVVFSGITPTIFESQVLVHAQDMRRANVDLEVWVFAGTAKAYRTSLCFQDELRRRFAIDLRVFRAVRPAVPLSEVLNAIVFLVCLRKFKCRAAVVHARADYSAAVCGLASLSGKFQLIWDSRGDTAAEFRLAEPGTTTWRRIKAAYRLCQISLRLRLAARLCDKALFVSATLREKVGSSVRPRHVEIVPSVASAELFYFSSLLRRQLRQQLHVSDDQTLLIYSGSLDRYQSFPSHIDYFRRLHAASPSTVLIVLTPNRQEAKPYLGSLPDGSWRLLTVAMPEVNAYLCAADFGLFLRERNEVNYVASPVKFAEYSLAGLPVVMTDAVEQSLSFGRVMGNAIVINPEAEPPVLVPINDAARAEIAQNAKKMLSREAAIAKYARLYGDSRCVGGVIAECETSKETRFNK